MKRKKSLLGTVVKVWLLVDTVRTVIAFLNARGLHKEDDRHLIGKAIDRYTGYAVDCDEVVTIDDTEMHVSYNPYMQLLTNSLGGVATVINGTTEVYTDAQFRSLSKDTQYAILCHELGHYKSNHKPGITYQWDRIKAIFNNKVLPMELEADAYACSIVGPKAMINALVELGSIKGISKKELKLRINHIKTM